MKWTCRKALKMNGTEFQQFANCWSFVLIKKKHLNFLPFFNAIARRTKNVHHKTENDLFCFFSFWKILGHLTSLKQIETSDIFNVNPKEFFLFFNQNKTNREGNERLLRNVRNQEKIFLNNRDLSKENKATESRRRRWSWWNRF